MKNYFYRIKVPKLFDNGYINEWEYKPIDIGVKIMKLKQFESVKSAKRN